MAGLAGLPYFIQYQGQLQEQAAQRQKAQQDMLAFQQAQQDRQRQQAAQAAAGNALPQLFAGGQPAAIPAPPPPQPPAPGQPSQPSFQMAGGGAPVPGATSTAAPQRPMQPPPFRPMPTQPPVQAQPQPAIPAPPQPQQAPAPQQQSGPLTYENAIKVLRDQGLSGADLFAGLQQLSPIMDTQAKAQAAAAQMQFNHEIQQQRIDAQQQMLDERIKHDRELESAAKGRLGVAEGNLEVRRSKAGGRGAGGGGGGGGLPSSPPPLPPEGDPLQPKAVAGYSSDAIKALGDDYAMRGPSALSGFGNKNFPAAARTAVVNYAAAKNSQTGQNFATNKIQYGADTAGARANAIQASKVDAAANALTSEGGIGDQFQQAVDALNRTGVPIANAAQMQILRLSNDPRVAAYDAAQNGVVSEAAQILGRGTLTVNSMEEARRVVNGWHTSEQVRAGLAQMKKEAATTVKASSEEVAKSARTPKGQPGVQAGPAVGTVEGGYRFKGGDPSKQSNWEKVQ